MTNTHDEASGTPKHPEIIISAEHGTFTLCAPEMGHQLSATSFESNETFWAPTEILNINLQEIPGLDSLYIRGSGELSEIEPSLSSGGEFVLQRIQGDLVKSYNFAWVTNGNAVYFGMPRKKFEAHHTPVDEYTGPEDSFGHTGIDIC